MESASLKQAIRSEMRDGNKPRQLSSLGNRGGADYMTFTGGSGDACVGTSTLRPRAGSRLPVDPLWRALRVARPAAHRCRDRRFIRRRDVPRLASGSGGTEARPPVARPC